MFGSLLKGTIGIVGDVAKVVIAPVAVAVDVTRAATKPIADAVEDAAKDVHDELSDDNK